MTTLSAGAVIYQIQLRKYELFGLVITVGDVIFPPQPENREFQMIYYQYTLAEL